ncbi:MAG: hypothetical protein Q7R80_00540 [bacterium]|nr:hypothetical protein [bacterium]
MESLPERFEDIAHEPAHEFLAHRALSESWISNINFGFRAFGALLSPPVFGPTATIAIIIGVAMKTWWVLVPYGAAWVVASAALALWNRRRWRFDPRWRSARVLLERAERIREAVRVFRLHCELYREWHREVSLGLREADDERASRYHDALDRARRILKSAILQTDFLAEKLIEGFVLTDETQPPPSLTLALEGVDAAAARALPVGDAFDPAMSFRGEEAMTRVLERLEETRMLPERT